MLNAQHPSSGLFVHCVFLAAYTKENTWQFFCNVLLCPVILICLCRKTFFPPIWKCLLFTQLHIYLISSSYGVCVATSNASSMLLDCSQKFSGSSCPQAHVHLREDFWALTVHSSPWVLLFVDNHLCLTAACWPIGRMWKDSADESIWSINKGQKRNIRCLKGLCFVTEPSHQEWDSEILVVSHASVLRWPRGLRRFAVEEVQAAVWVTPSGNKLANIIHWELYLSASLCLMCSSPLGSFWLNILYFFYRKLLTKDAINSGESPTSTACYAQRWIMGSLLCPRELRKHFLKGVSNWVACLWRKRKGK